MNKAVLLPLYFAEINEREKGELKEQLKKLEDLYGGEAEFLEPIPVGEQIPETAQAVLFAQMTGAVFRYREQISQIRLPVILMTSEFGTVEMWDWEIAAYLRENLGMDNVFTPYSSEMAKVILRAVSSRHAMREGGKFLIFQDSPGEGMQAYIFKRFFWWERECVQRIEEYFGIRIIFKSWKKLNEKAKAIDGEEALAYWKKNEIPSCDAGQDALLYAVKLYLAIRSEVLKEGNVLGVGSNCLNESFSSETTPCLALNWLFEQEGILWACEGDLVSLLSEVIFYQALRTPLMMTNLYPFLVGMAALKHERIDRFPEIEDSDNCALGVHCGYFGFAPLSFCSRWTLRPKVLEIVNENAVAIDCEMECGPVLLAKVHADMKKITVIRARIEKYVGYPGSDCLNGALIRYQSDCGHQVMESLSSHHAIVIKGDVAHLIRQIGRVYGIEVEVF